MVKEVIYCFWTGDNPLTESRLRSLQALRERSGVPIMLVTKQNLSEFILPEHPLIEAYQYLSETHKADYLRTYFMNFHGGGYSDIKIPTGDWRPAFEELRQNPDKLANGYHEQHPDWVAYPPSKIHWQRLIGNGSYIFRPHSELTERWYAAMIELLTSKTEELRAHPARFPQDCRDIYHSAYPIEWSEMLGRIFHRICTDYLDRFLYSVPIPVLRDYR